MLTASSHPDPDELAGPRPVGHWRLAWRRLRRDRVAMASGIFIVCLLLAVTAGAPLLERILGHGPNEPFPYAVDVTLKPSGPWTRVPDLNKLPEGGGIADLDDLGEGTIEPGALNLEHPPAPKGTPDTLLAAGADGTLGRDHLLRLLYGGRVSLIVALGAAALALAIGVVLGTIAGWFGGWVDALVSRLTDLAMAFPVLLFLILIGSTVNPLGDVRLGGLVNEGVVSLVVMIGVFSWFYPARIVRAQILSLREREFVEAAEMIGTRDARILRTHLVPHLVPPLVVIGTLMVATNILLEAGVTFLGAGVELPTASWGTLLTTTWGTPLAPNPYNPVNFQPWLTILPSAAIALTVLAFNQFGEGLREALDPRRVR